MKSKFIEVNEGPSKLPFPKLMQHESSDLVVFFMKEDCGVVVSIDDDEESHKIGDYSCSWNTVEFNNLPVNLGITLSNG
jgi:hypothetical protein